MSSGLTMSQMNRTSPTGSQGCSPVTANCGGSGAASAAGSGSGSGAPQPTATIVTNPSAASFTALMTSLLPDRVGDRISPQGYDTRLRAGVRAA